jgi:hypothetical protein
MKIAQLIEDCPEGPLKLSLEISAGRRNTEIADTFRFSAEEIRLIISALIQFS